MERSKKRIALVSVIGLFAVLWVPFVFFLVRLLIERTVEMEMTVAICFGITLQITLVLLLILAIILIIIKIVKKKRSDHSMKKGSITK